MFKHIQTQHYYELKKKQRYNKKLYLEYKK